MCASNIEPTADINVTAGARAVLGGALPRPLASEVTAYPCFGADIARARWLHRGARSEGVIALLRKRIVTYELAPANNRRWSRRAPIKTIPFAHLEAIERSPSRDYGLVLVPLEATTPYDAWALDWDESAEQGLRLDDIVLSHFAASISMQFGIEVGDQWIDGPR